MIARFADGLFNNINKKQNDKSQNQSKSQRKYTYQVEASMLQLYREELYDLLDDPHNTKGTVSFLSFFNT